MIIVSDCTCKLLGPLLFCAAEDIHTVSSSPPSNICAYCYAATDLDCVLGLILTSDWSQSRSRIGFLDFHWRSALSVKSYPPPARLVGSLRYPFSRRWVGAAVPGLACSPLNSCFEFDAPLVDLLHYCASERPRSGVCTPVFICPSI